MRATPVNAERQNTMLEDLVQRLSLESDIAAIGWELVTAGDGMNRCVSHPQIPPREAPVVDDIQCNEAARLMRPTWVLISACRARTKQVLIGAFFVAVALPLCFAQADRTDIHVTPRYIRSASPSEVRPRNGATELFKADASLVLVPVTVTDQKDRLVIGLDMDNFSVFDGQERQVIRHLSNEDAPISLGIIFDTSSSMYGKLERSSEAVVQFLRTANPDDEFFLIGFADRPELLVNFTSSVEEIQDGISKVSPDGRTALLDAVYLGLDTMRQARNERKILLIVSDGGENHSRYNIREVWSVVKEAGVQIYAMGIFDEAPRTKAERLGPDLLTAVSTVTGGRVFAIHSVKKIRAATSALAIELRNQYLIAYRPSDLMHDGKWHRISVRVTPPQNSPRLRVYAKRGYYAPAE